MIDLRGESGRMIHLQPIYGGSILAYADARPLSLLYAEYPLEHWCRGGSRTIPYSSFCVATVTIQHC